MTLPYVKKFNSIWNNLSIVINCSKYKSLEEFYFFIKTVDIPALSPSKILIKTLDIINNKFIVYILFVV